LLVMAQLQLRNKQSFLMHPLLYPFLVI